MSGSWSTGRERSSRGLASRTTVTRRPPALVRDDPHRDTLGRWTIALSRGDEAEVERLVSESRNERIRAAATGPAAVVGVVEQLRHGDAAR